MGSVMNVVKYLTEGDFYGSGQAFGNSGFEFHLHIFGFAKNRRYMSTDFENSIVSSLVFEQVKTLMSLLYELNHIIKFLS